MIKRIKTKLRGRSGESIAETLVATLIAALALVMLAGAVTTAAKIVTRSRSEVKNHYETDEMQAVPDQDRNEIVNAITSAISEP